MYVYNGLETQETPLVNWAEDMIREADFESKNFELIRDILARIGLADVREFGLTWVAIQTLKLSQ